MYAGASALCSLSFTSMAKSVACALLALLALTTYYSPGAREITTAII